MEGAVACKAYKHCEIGNWPGETTNAYKYVFRGILFDYGDKLDGVVHSLLQALTLDVCLLESFHLFTLKLWCQNAGLKLEVLCRTRTPEDISAVVQVARNAREFINQLD